MAEDGVLAAVLPEATRLDRLGRLIALDLEVDPLRRLAALVAVDADDMASLAARLRLSNAARDRLVGLAAPRPLDPTGGATAQRHALYRLGAERYRDAALLSAAAGSIAAARLGELLALAAAAPPPAFPVAGRDVRALGIAAGPRVGRLLAELRGWWEAGDFTADRPACLARLKEMVNRPSGA
jgi:poly(A) polymerase